ncbi:hypothetical protein KNE206_76640 [Kitasatospora sp. NE20-6]|uniref:hypothetical protein n=1 Tax=Kitasatospora sp. NE20-6 TaxID=2859066 RepID=UPI0034DC7EB2
MITQGAVRHVSKRVAASTAAVFHMPDDEACLLIAEPDGRPADPEGGPLIENLAPGGLAHWLTAVVSPQESTWHPLFPIVACFAAREAAMEGTDPGRLALFGQQLLGLNRSDRWTEAVSTVLLGQWIYPLSNGTGLGLSALGQLRQEARTIHRQLVPLWQRRTYGNKRVALLESPVCEGTTLRDLLADRYLPEDTLLDQVPGDRRLAAVLDRLEPLELAVVLARGQHGVDTWAQAAEHAGSAEPEKDGRKVRRKVGRVVQELCRRDRQRADGPTGLWTPAPTGGVR